MIARTTSRPTPIRPRHPLTIEDTGCPGKHATFLGGCRRYSTSRSIEAIDKNGDNLAQDFLARASIRRQETQNLRREPIVENQRLKANPVSQ
jgi:hypothetical protein